MDTMTVFTLYNRPINPWISLHYRGVDRCPPFYDKNLPADDPYNLAFVRFVHVDEAAMTLDMAIDFAKEMAALDHLNEVVALNCTEVLPVRNTLLGYDVAIGYGDSLLANYIGVDLRGEDPLWHVMHKYFLPKLNGYGLLSSIDDASLFTAAMKQHNRAFNSYEAPEAMLKLKPVSITLIEV
jgi:hypothetical protein